jgi:hypothetical protein
MTIRADAKREARRRGGRGVTLRPPARGMKMGVAPAGLLALMHTYEYHVPKKVRSEELCT